MSDFEKLIEAVWQQIERIDRVGASTRGAASRRKKTIGTTPHSGIYLMNISARNRASEAQKDRWAEFRQARESEIDDRTKTLRRP